MAFDAHSKRMNLAVSGCPGTVEHFVFLFKINTLKCVDYLHKQRDYVYDHEEEERSTIRPQSKKDNFALQNSNIIIEGLF